MTKPDFAPRRGHVWAVRVYPGGRSEWAMIEEATWRNHCRANKLMLLRRGATALVADEDEAQALLLQLEKRP